MPPKVKFTKEQVVAAALELTAARGLPGLTARAVAARLGCSVKPIFGLFQNMEQLQQQVLAAAGQRFGAAARAEIAAGKYPPYKAVGMSYIRFARQEPELFRLLFLTPGQQLRQDPELLELICRNTGLSPEQAKLFHLEMWVCVHGVAALSLNPDLHLDEEIASRILTDTYEGLRYRFCGEGGNHGGNQNPGTYQAL